jgi:5-methylthioadenosine/S-adenosylhomocysteine deaminase
MTAARQTILHGGLVVTMDRDRRIIRDGAVVIQDEKIAAVGKADALLVQFSQAAIHDFSGRMIIPGLIDAHNHPAHFLTKGLLDDMETTRRWKTRLYPFEQAVTEQETYWGALATFAEMIKSGTTTVADPGNLHPNGVARAARDIGLRVMVAAAVSDVNDPSRPWGLQHAAEAATAANELLFERWHRAEGGRIRVSLGLWSPTTVSAELVRHVAKLAERLDTGIHGHLAAKPLDNEITLARHGCRAVEWYHQLGALNERLLAAHMGAVNARDVELVLRSGAHVVHCPSASMFGAFGCIAHGQFPELVKGGAVVALGTDAASISRFLDMAREMYLAACAHKDARMDAEVMGAHKAMEMATIDGARALWWDDQIGSIEAGKKADLTIVRMDGLEWQPRPMLNPVANFIYSSSGQRVETVFVNGRCLLRDGALQTVDENSLRAEAADAAESATARAGISGVSVWPVI